MIPGVVRAFKRVHRMLSPALAHRSPTVPGAGRNGLIEAASALRAPMPLMTLWRWLRPQADVDFERGDRTSPGRGVRSTRLWR
jgi:hypothetical protein